MLQLLQLVMLYCGLDFSLRTCAGKMAEMQGYLSDTAVKNRLAACVPWVKVLLTAVFGLGRIVNEGHLRFVVIDGSTVEVPGAKGTSYRLHIAVDVVKLELLEVTVTDDKIGEGLEHYTLKNGDIVVIDRGYNQPKSLVPFIDRGGDVVLRYNPHGMKLYGRAEGDGKIAWTDALRKLGGQRGAVPVHLCHGDKRLDGVVHAVPLPPEKAAEARRRLQQKARKKGRTPSAEALYLSGWVLLFSNVPPAVLDTDTVAALYRVRWQVELVIKRLKSLSDIDLLRARKGSALADLYLHGKLLYAAVIEKIARRRFDWASVGMAPERTQTPWRLWTLLAAEVRAGVITSLPRRAVYQADGLKASRERPRKRPLQTLPKGIFELLDTCRKLQVSDV